MKTNFYFDLYIKSEYSDKFEPMTKLTSGLMRVFHLSTQTKDTVFTRSDEIATGLTIEELHMCVKWRDLHLERCVYGMNYNDRDETEQEIQDRRSVYNRITPLMKDIEYLLGQPQGSFAV